MGGKHTYIAKWKATEAACADPTTSSILRGYKRWYLPSNDNQDKRYYKFRVQVLQMVERLHSRFSTKRDKGESLLGIEEGGCELHKAIQESLDCETVRNITEEEEHTNCNRACIMPKEVWD